MDENRHRPLTKGERRILEYIREVYGEQNTEDEVFISDDDEAVIFVKDIDGSMPVMIVLTNVAMTQRQENLSRDDVCREYLIPFDEDPESFLKIQELKALPEGLSVTCVPNPVRARRDRRVNYRYAWIFATTVDAINRSVEIEEFGCFDYLDDTWILSNFSGEAYPKDKFAAWYSCPDAILTPGSPVTDPTNWFGRDELCAGEVLWYYVGREPDGTRVWGGAKVELLAVFDKSEDGDESIGSDSIDEEDEV